MFKKKENIFATFKLLLNFESKFDKKNILSAVFDMNVKVHFQFSLKKSQLV